MKGDPGSLINLGTGCRFFARCKYATPECEKEDPEILNVGNGHQVACIHPLKMEA